MVFQFKHCGQFIFAPGANEDQVMEVALEAGAEDVISDDDGAIEVLTAPADFEAVKNALLKLTSSFHSDQSIVLDRVIRSSPTLMTASRAKYIAQEEAIFEALERNGGDKPKTAAELGIALKTLYNRLNQSALQSEAG